jgi:hypothetical protein
VPSALYLYMGRYCLHLYSQVFLYGWMCALLHYIKRCISDYIIFRYYLEKRGILRRKMYLDIGFLGQIAFVLRLCLWMVSFMRNHSALSKYIFLQSIPLFSK